MIKFDLFFVAYFSENKIGCTISHLVVHIYMVSTIMLYIVNIYLLTLRDLLQKYLY